MLCEMAVITENVVVDELDLKLTFSSNVAIVGPTFSVCSIFIMHNYLDANIK